MQNRKQPTKKVLKNESSSASIADKDENDEFEIFTSSQLEAGDILLIKKDEFVAADILILDSAERSFDVNQQRQNGMSSLQSKEALRVTFEDQNSQVKGKFEEYKKQLNCQIEYSPDTLEGTLRLKVEPTGEKFSIENILLNGTHLHRVDWVFGLVLKCGAESTIFEATDFSRKKQNIFDRILYKFSLFLIVLIILLSLLSRLLYSQRSNDSSDSDTMLYLSHNGWKDNSQIFIDSRSFYILYSICLPVAIYALIDILLLFQKLYLKQSCVSVYRVNNPDALPNLGTVNWAFFDKTGTITNNKLRIESIILGSELFFLDTNSEFFQQMRALEVSSQFEEQLEQHQQQHGDQPEIDIPSDVPQNNGTQDEDDKKNVDFVEVQENQKTRDKRPSIADGLDQKEENSSSLNNNTIQADKTTNKPDTVVTANFLKNRTSLRKSQIEESALQGSNSGFPSNSAVLLSNNPFFAKVANYHNQLQTSLILNKYPSSPTNPAPAATSILGVVKKILGVGSANKKRNNSTDSYDKNAGKKGGDSPQKVRRSSKRQHSLLFTTTNVLPINQNGAGSNNNLQKSMNCIGSNMNQGSVRNMQIMQDTNSPFSSSSNRHSSVDHKKRLESVFVKATSSKFAPNKEILGLSGNQVARKAEEIAQMQMLANSKKQKQQLQLQQREEENKYILQNISSRSLKSSVKGQLQNQPSSRSNKGITQANSINNNSFSKRSISEGSEQQQKRKLSSQSEPKLKQSSSSLENSKKIPQLVPQVSLNGTLVTSHDSATKSLRLQGGGVKHVDISSPIPLHGLKVSNKGKDEEEKQTNSSNNDTSDANQICNFFNSSPHGSDNENNNNKDNNNDNSENYFTIQKPLKLPAKKHNTIIQEVEEPAEYKEEDEQQNQNNKEEQEKNSSIEERTENNGNNESSRSIRVTQRMFDTSHTEGRRSRGYEKNTSYKLEKRSSNQLSEDQDIQKEDEEKAAVSPASSRSSPSHPSNKYKIQNPSFGVLQDNPNLQVFPAIPTPSYTAQLSSIQLDLSHEESSLFFPEERVNLNTVKLWCFTNSPTDFQMLHNTQQQAPSSLTDILQTSLSTPNSLPLPQIIKTQQQQQFFASSKLANVRNAQSQQGGMMNLNLQFQSLFQNKPALVLADSDVISPQVNSPTDQFNFSSNNALLFDQNIMNQAEKGQQEEQQEDEEENQEQQQEQQQQQHQLYPPQQQYRNPLLTLQNTQLLHVPSSSLNPGKQPIFSSNTTLNNSFIIASQDLLNNSNYILNSPKKSSFSNLAILSNNNQNHNNPSNIIPPAPAAPAPQSMLLSGKSTSGPQTFKKRLLQRGQSFDVMNNNTLGIKKAKFGSNNAQHDEPATTGQVLTRQGSQQTIKALASPLPLPLAEMRRFQVLKYSNSSNILESQKAKHSSQLFGHSPLSIPVIRNEILDSNTPISFKRVRQAKLTRVNSMHHMNNLPNVQIANMLGSQINGSTAFGQTNMLNGQQQQQQQQQQGNLSTSVLNHSEQLPDVIVPRITYHEGDEELQNRIAEYAEKTEDFMKALIVCQGWKIRIEKDRLVQMEGKKREDEYIYKYVKNLGIKCELRKKRYQYYLISNSKNESAPSSKVVIRQQIDFNSTRTRCSFLVEESKEPSEMQKKKNKGNHRHFLLNIQPPSFSLQFIHIMILRSLTQDSPLLFVSRYVRGDEDLFDLCSDMSEVFKERLRFCINKQFELGSRAIVYGKKVVSKKQVDEIESFIKTMKSSVEEYEGFYNEVLNEIESEIQFLGVIFIQEQINEGFKENLQFMNDCLIKVGILSGDSMEKVKSVANQCQFTLPQYGLEQKVFEIEGLTKEEISISIKKSLSQLKDLIQQHDSAEGRHPSQMFILPQEKEEGEDREQMDKHNNDVAGAVHMNKHPSGDDLEHNKNLDPRFAHLLNNPLQFSFTQDRKVFQNVLIVGQKQLDVISTNQSLEAHFAFILAHVGKVIAYELRAEHKQYFVRLAKFIDRKSTVMAIGDGWNDALMMQISDISFEFRSDAQDSQVKENIFAHEAKSQGLKSFKTSVNDQATKQTQSQSKKSFLKSSTVGVRADRNSDPLARLKSSTPPASNSPQQGSMFSTLLTTSITKSKDDKKKKQLTLALTHPNAGDIVIQHLSAVKHLMKFYSPRLLMQAQFVLFETFSFHFLLFLFNLSANWQTFSATVQLIDSDYLFLSFFIFVPRCLVYIFCYEPLYLSHHFPLLLLFDKLYHNNKEQRRVLRVSSLLLNSLIESVVYFLGIFVVSVFVNINDSADNLRFYLMIQILIVSRFKMFLHKQAGTKHPTLIYAAQAVYEVLVSYLYFGVYWEYDDAQSRPDMQLAFSDIQNIMGLLFNLFITGIFAVIFTQCKVLLNNRFTNRLLVKIDKLQQNAIALPQNLLLQAYLDKLATLDQFLEHSIQTLKKPYELIKRIFREVKIDKHIEQLLNPAELAFNQEMGFNNRTLEFLDQGLQRIYEIQMSKSNLFSMRFLMIINSLPSLIICIVSYSLNKSLRGEEEYSSTTSSFRIICLVFCILYMLLGFVFFREKFLPIMKYIFTLFILVALCFEIIQGWSQKNDFSAIAPFLSYEISLFPFSFPLSFLFSAINLAQQYIWFSIHAQSEILSVALLYIKDTQQTLALLYLYVCYFLIIGVCFSNSMLTKYVNERENKNDFLLGIQFQEEKAQRQDILGILLPEFIREDVILGKTNFSRDQEEASILFCDVSEFDKIMDAEDYKIVSLLDNLFREFDELTFSYGLQKIETVGKTYMAAGGLKAVERNLSKKITRTNHYIRMLMMSQKMHGVAMKSQWGRGYSIKLKIGVHIGPITAGVIGYHKPQFSLIGDTVNTTSRLCSNCEPGKSLFSDVIFEKISPYLESTDSEIDWAYEEFRFEAKGKGILTAYYIFDQNDEFEIMKSSAHENQQQQQQTLQKQQQPAHQDIIIAHSKPKKRGLRKLHTKIYDLQARLSESGDFDLHESMKSPADIHSYDLQKITNSQSLGGRPSILSKGPNDTHSINGQNNRKNSSNTLNSKKGSNRTIHEPEVVVVGQIPGTPNNGGFSQPAQYKQPQIKYEVTQKITKNSYEEEDNANNNSVKQTPPLHPTFPPIGRLTDKQKNHMNASQSVKNSTLLEGSLGKPTSSQMINSMHRKESVISIIMRDQHNPQDDDRAASFHNISLAGSIAKQNIGPRRNNRLKTIDPNKIQNLLRRQDSGSSPEKQDGLDEYGNNLGNIEDDSSASGPIDDSEVEIIKYNWLLESARDSIDLFKDFEQQYFTKHNQMFILQLLMLGLMSFLMMTFRILILSNNGINWVFYSMDILSMSSIVIIVLTWERLKNSFQLRRITVISLFLQITSVLGEFYYSHNGIFKILDMLQISALLILYTTNMCSRILDSIVFQILAIGAFQIIDIIKGSYCISDIIMLLILAVGFLFQKRESYMRNLELYNKNRTNDYQRNQEVRLLVHLLPTHIYHTFLRNPEDNSIFTEKFTQTTLLFADISGFTAYSSNKKPEQVVKMLKSLFTKFDHKCMKHNVFKLYTIGDCYIVMGFSDANKRDPPTEAKNVVEMGFSMIESLRAFRQEQKDPSDTIDDIDMRIGIHIGDIIGGVIGKSVVRYDIYGKDVLLANKMESNGERGRILLSEPLKLVLQEHFPDRYEYKSGPEVQVKTINIKLKSFFVGKKSE